MKITLKKKTEMCEEHFYKGEIVVTCIRDVCVNNI